MTFEEHLMSESTSSGVSPEELKMLAKQASKMYLVEKIPLNAGVVKVASSNRRLNSEHVKRIVEFANQETFLSLFNKEQDKHIHFPVADPSIVIKELADGSHPGHENKMDNRDYASAPKKPEQVELFGFSDPYNSSDQVKTAFEHANPNEDLANTLYRLQAAHFNLEDSLFSLETLKTKTASTFYDSVKEEIINEDGGGLAGVVLVLEKLASRDDVMGVLDSLIPSLLESEDVTYIQLKDSMTKLAYLDEVNPKSSLISSFLELKKLANDIQTTKLALKEASEGINMIKKSMRNA